MTAITLNRRVVLPVLALGAAGLLVAVGCGKKDEGPKYKVIEGKVTVIDPSSDEVEMLWYNPEKMKETKVRGTLDSQAEIFINGRTAKLADVVVGDQVEVTGRIEKHDGEPKLVAVKVHVERKTDTQPADATAPATQSE